MFLFNSSAYPQFIRIPILLFQDLFVTLQIERKNKKRLLYGYQEEDRCGANL